MITAALTTATDTVLRELARFALATVMRAYDPPKMDKGVIVVELFVFDNTIYGYTPQGYLCQRRYRPGSASC